MIILCCLICEGEIEIIGNEKYFIKKVKCFDCGFTNDNSYKKKKYIPEICYIKNK